MADIDPIVVRFIADVSDATSNIQKSFTELNQGLEVFEKAAGILEGTVESIREIGNQAETILDLAEAFDVSTQSVQEWQNAAIIAGESAGYYQTMVMRVTTAMDNSKDSTSAAAQAFAKMGMSDLTGKSVNEVMNEIAKSLGEVTDATERASIAKAIFGRNYATAEAVLAKYNETLGTTNTLTKEQLLTLQESGDIIEKTGIKIDYMIKTTLSGLLSLKGVGHFSDTGSSLRNMWGTTDPSELAKPFVSSTQMAAESYTSLYANMSALDMEIYDSKTKQEESLAAMKKAKTQDEYTASEKIWTQEKNHYADLLKMQADISAPAAARVSAASTGATWDSTALVGTAGSEMEIFMANEKAKGVDYQTALANWQSGASSSGDITGTVAGMTSTGTGMDKNAKSSEETVADKAAEAHRKQIADTTEFTKQTTKLYESMYAQNEKNSLTHWTSESEMARISTQNTMDNWATGANWINSTIAHEQTITMTDGHENASPVVFATTTAPTLATADFSGVKMVMPTGEGTKETGGTNVTNNVSVTIQGNANADDVEKGINKGLAGVQYAGGGFV